MSSLCDLVSFDALVSASGVTATASGSGSSVNETAGVGNDGNDVMLELAQENVIGMADDSRVSLGKRVTKGRMSSPLT